MTALNRTQFYPLPFKVWNKTTNIHCKPFCLPEAAMPTRHDVASVRYAVSTGPTLQATFMDVFIMLYQVPNSVGEYHCKIIDARQ